MVNHEDYSQNRKVLVLGIFCACVLWESLVYIFEVPILTLGYNATLFLPTVIQVATSLMMVLKTVELAFNSQAEVFTA